MLLGTLSACTPNGSYIILVTATPSGAVPGPATGGSAGLAVGSPPVVETSAQPPQPIPTPTFIPTPDPTRSAAVDLNQDQIHVVQSGDTLGQIAAGYGTTVEAIIQANQIANPNVLTVGEALVIPLAAQTTGPLFKIIPDSELVYGPSVKGFDVQQVMQTLPTSYLANYTEALDGGRVLTGPQIVQRVALEQSVNPRLLLALLEYETHWLSQTSVSDQAATYPMNYYGQPTTVTGLYWQLDWAGKMLQAGYYGWKERGLTGALLSDGMRVQINPGINAGTAGVELLLAQTRTLDVWTQAVSHSGFFATDVSLFGDPFQRAVEPLIPPDLVQPPMGLPFSSSETWYFTGGPHGGWGSSSAWSALDFVTGDEPSLGCEVADRWARAVADGIIARSDYGMVILDLDGDGFEGTGWTVFYLHISSDGRPVTAGQQVKQGDPIGHPSCEGGISYATHMHIARRYNGEWMPVDCAGCALTSPAPELDFDGWLGHTFGTEYDGSLTKGDEYREACTCRLPINTFAPPASNAGG